MPDLTSRRDFYRELIKVLLIVTTHPDQAPPFRGVKRPDYLSCAPNAIQRRNKVSCVMPLLLGLVEESNDSAEGGSYPIELFQVWIRPLNCW